MSRLTRDGTSEPASQDQILRRKRGQRNIHFPCAADHERDWQSYPVDPYSARSDDHTYIHRLNIYVCGVSTGRAREAGGGGSFWFLFIVLLSIHAILECFSPSIRCADCSSAYEWRR